MIHSKIGTFKSSIADLKLEERMLRANTLILAEEGSGKTHLASKIRRFVIENFYYMRFEESDAFDAALAEAIAARKDIYMAVNPSFFSNKRDVKSRLSLMLQTPELLENYYYFFHEISCLNAFYTKFEDFLLYIFNIVNMKQFGLTFLSQPHETFEDPRIKLLFTFLFLGKCTNANYFNTAELKNFKPNTFYYQYRMDHKTLLFNRVKGDVVYIDA